MSQQHADSDERNGDALDKDQGHARGEAHVHELVVDVGLVWQERILVAAHTAQNHTDNIQARYQQDAEGNHDRSTLGLEGVVAYVHAVFDNQEAEDVAQGKATGIAHENLIATLGIAKHVVDEEGDEHTHADEGGLGIEPQVVLGKEDAEGTQGYDTDAGGQAVDAVDEVDGIGDEDHQQHGERNADERSNLVDAQQAVEVVDVQAGDREEGRGDNLNLELVAVTDTYQVVANADDVQQRKAGNETKHLGGNPCSEIVIGQLVYKHPIHGEDADGKHDNREEGYSA